MRTIHLSTDLTVYGLSIGNQPIVWDQLLILNTSLALILFCPLLRDFDEKPKHSSEEIEDHW